MNSLKEKFKLLPLQFDRKRLLIRGAEVQSTHISVQLGLYGLNNKEVSEKMSQLTKEFKGYRVVVIIYIDPLNRQFELELEEPSSSTKLKILAKKTGQVLKSQLINLSKSLNRSSKELEGTLKSLKIGLKDD